MVMVYCYKCRFYRKEGFLHSQNSLFCYKESFENYIANMGLVGGQYNLFWSWRNGWTHIVFSTVNRLYSSLPKVSKVQKLFLPQLIGSVDISPTAENSSGYLSGKVPSIKYVENFLAVFDTPSPITGSIFEYFCPKLSKSVQHDL